MLAAAAFVHPSGISADIDIHEFEEITPDIQVIDPGGRRTTDMEEMVVQPVEVGDDDFDFEEVRIEPTTPRPAPPRVAEPAPPAPVEPPPPAPVEVHPVVEAPPAPPPIAEPVAPPPVAPPIAAPATPEVRVVERGPMLPQAQPAPLIPVEPPPERERLRAPEEIQVGRAYRPEGLDLALDENYEAELGDLQRQLALLRERVIETKSRIITYGERVARGYTGGTRVQMTNDYDLGRKFRVESITYYLDGHQIYSKNFDGEEVSGETSIYRGSILPGRHKLDMEVVLQAPSGMFDFSRSARLRFTTSEYFTANEGKQINLNVRVFDRGGFFRSVEDRPGISFEITEEDAY
jgi:hypothetical protein